MTLWLSLLVVAGVSLVLTGAVHRFALSRSLLDLPNALSSRLIPTRWASLLLVMAVLGFLSRNLSLARIFIQDAGSGVIKRFLVGDRSYEAHCSYACHIASRLSGVQSVVPTVVLMIFLFWLLPNTLCAEFLDFDGFTAVILAYVPLVLLALKFNSGNVFFKKRDLVFWL